MAGRNEIFVLWDIPKPDTTELRRVVAQVQSSLRAQTPRPTPPSADPPLPPPARPSQKTGT